MAKSRVIERLPGCRITAPVILGELMEECEPGDSLFVVRVRSGEAVVMTTPFNPAEICLAAIALQAHAVDEYLRDD